jgi:hypothetical protein
MFTGIGASCVPVNCICATNEVGIMSASFLLS